jgi:hypothetical protein
MDPFLEDLAGWPGVHARLLTAIGDDLAATLSPRYRVDIEERVYVTDPDEDPGYASFVPDVIVSRPAGAADSRVDPGGATRITAPVILSGNIDEEIRDRFLSIRDAKSREVVTALEVLSPANKVRGSRGREALGAKRGQILAAGANWLEIDLLRGGVRSPRIAHRCDYCVLLLRPGRSGALAWPFGLEEPLPVVAVPLRPPHEDVPLDLAGILRGCYERGRYEDGIDYGADVPPPPLGGEQAAWASARLEAWRARRGGPRG